MRTKILLGMLAFLAGISSAAASADISITKSASVGYQENIARLSDLEITINYQNAGPDAAEDVVLEDPYGNAYGMVWGLPEECESVSTKLRCDLGTLAAGASGTITYSAQISIGAPLQMITTYANITAKTPDEVTFNNSAAVRFRVTPIKEKYFYYSFTDSSKTIAPTVTKEDDGYPDNVRPIVTNEEEDEEKMEEKEVVVEKTSEETKERQVIVTYNPPPVEATATPRVTLTAATPVVTAPKLVSTGASVIFLGLSALFLTFLVRRKKLMEK